MANAYLHYRFKYGEFELLTADSDSTLGPLDDFVTGLIDYTNAYQFENYRNFSDGTTVGSPGAATDDNVITVVSTTSFVVGQTVAVRLDVDTFHKARITAFTPDTNITISGGGISSAAAQGNEVVTINQLQGSVTGSADRNYKADKAQQVLSKSIDLEAGGFEYNGRDFFLNINGSGNFDPRFTNDYLRLIGLRGLLPNMNGQATLDIDERPYVFSSNTDFDDFYVEYYGDVSGSPIGRIVEIYGGGTGQSGLINQVTEAGNDLTSMDGIVDSRT